mgnify:CR=1 FL=1
MACGASYLFKVIVLAARADALLRGGGPDVITLLMTEEHVFELVHAGVGEQQRRVAGRNERRRGQRAVAPGGEEGEKRLANLVAGKHRHGPLSLFAVSLCLAGVALQAGRLIESQGR